MEKESAGEKPAMDRPQGERKTPLWALLVGLVSLVAIQQLLPKEKSWLGLPLFMAVIFAVGFAVNLVKGRVADAANRAAEIVFTPVSQVAIVFVALMPAAAVYTASRWLSETAPRWGQSIVLVLSAFLLYYLLHEIYAPGGLERVFLRFRKQGPLVPLVIAINLLLAYVGLFSTFVLALPSSDTLFVGVAHPDHGKVADFFVWHFFEMIPLFDLNETIPWKAPLTYERNAVGWILVLFKLVVALPVIWLIAAYYEDRKKSHS